jgi:hypothetical protein
MTKWDDFAHHIQAVGRDGDAQKLDTYTDEQIRRAIVYTRQDVTVLCAHLSGVNRQLSEIKIALWVIAVACASIAGVLFRHFH